MTALKTPTGRRQPVGYLQAWPRTCTWDNRGTNPASGDPGPPD